ncbi:MAG: protein kinase [Planctomycetota bacterium]
MSADEVIASQALDTPTAEAAKTDAELVLTFLSGTLSGQTFEFLGPRKVVIGRAGGCDIGVFDNRVSRRHCSIDFEGGRAQVKDLGSANGTYVNGTQTGLGVLRAGDRLRLGDTEVRIDIQERARTVRPSGSASEEITPVSTTFLRRTHLRIPIPGYTLGGCVGEGATGAVFRARAADGRVVAIKVIDASDTLPEEDRRRFEREIELAMSLDHPNVVRTLGHGQEGPFLYLVMEFVEGETLRSRIAKQGELPVPVALHVLRQIASALDYARTQDLVHRDVKPENILIGDDGVAKLTDFGLAKSVLTAGRSGLTRVGDVLGTLAYMSPEQLASSVNADHRSDIYSLGASLHHMLTGETPFKARTNVDYLNKILCEPPPLIVLSRPEVPPIVGTLAAKCMRKKPEERYQTAAEIVKIANQLLATGFEQRNTVS